MELDVRPEVAAFALLMEKRLRENNHKPGWKGDNPGELFNRIVDEADELRDALERMESGTSKRLKSAGRRDVPIEAADVANFAMMVADVCGALKIEEPGHGA